MQKLGWEQKITQIVMGEAVGYSEIGRFYSRE